MKLRTLDDVMTPLAPASLEEWEGMKKDLLDNLRFSSAIGLLRHDSPLNAKIFGTKEYDGFCVDKVIFQSLPGFYVAGNLYRPKEIKGKIPMILSPHGHWTYGRVELSPLGRLPQRCANFALRGMAVFIWDMVGWNDSDQIDHNGYLPEFDDWGFSHFALQLNNSVKALDFACSLPWVDTERVGCTGCSGGGTQTWFLAALDPRVKAAAPINMVSAFMQGGCGCENAPFLRTRYCSVDYASCIAPRPLFLAASDGDWTAHSREVEFPAVRRVYELYGAEKNFETFYRSAPHSYDKPTREKAYDFFCRVFGLENPYPGEIDMELSPKDLLMGSVKQYAEKEGLEGFIKGEEELFETVKRLMRKNLKEASAETKDGILRRVFPRVPEEKLDISYVLEEKQGKKLLRLGACPPPYDTLGIKHVHAYNLGSDTLRVCALRSLMEKYPDREFTAEGKTSQLVKIAAELMNGGRIGETEDGWKMDIPGIELVKNFR